MLTTVMHSRRLRRLHRENTAAKLNAAIRIGKKHESTDGEALIIVIIVVALGLMTVLLPLGR